LKKIARKIKQTQKNIQKLTSAQKSGQNRDNNSGSKI